MTRRRRLLANAILLGILGGQAVAVVADRELWPFSNYPMFSTLRRPPTITRLWIYGVREDGVEAPLADRTTYRPLALSQVEMTLEHADERGIGEALGYLLGRYERRRRAGGYQGPPLAGLRLYRMTWGIDPRAANRDRPLSRELLGEARRELP